MTNGEMFKTTEERTIAFRKFCANKICKGREANCILSGKLHDKAKHMCEFAWLELEYMEELKPCPFCGSEASIINGLEDNYVICRNDDCAAAIVARSYSSPEEAIAAWNRRVK